MHRTNKYHSLPVKYDLNKFIIPSLTINNSGINTGINFKNNKPLKRLPLFLMHALASFLMSFTALSMIKPFSERFMFRACSSDLLQNSQKLLKRPVILICWSCNSPLKIILYLPHRSYKVSANFGTTPPRFIQYFRLILLIGTTAD